MNRVTQQRSLRLTGGYFIGRAGAFAISGWLGWDGMVRDTGFFALSLGMCFLPNIVPSHLSDRQWNVLIGLIFVATIAAAISLWSATGLHPDYAMAIVIAVFGASLIGATFLFRPKDPDAVE